MLHPTLILLSEFVARHLYDSSHENVFFKFIDYLKIGQFQNTHTHPHPPYTQTHTPPTPTHPPTHTQTKQNKTKITFMVV